MIQTTAALIKKEFYQVLRDRNMLRMIIIVPLVQLFVLGYAINTDVKFIDMAVYDFDRSSLSREYIRSFSTGDYFIPGNYDIRLTNLERGFQENHFKAALIIPEDFAKSFQKRQQIKIGFVADGTNANSAAIAQGYANLISMQFSRRNLGFPEPIKLRQKMLYNPEMETVYYMVPGIISVLITMITVMMTSMAIVREREVGTLEQLMVTPITVPSIILGKTIPFAILGFVVMSIALLFGVFYFSIPFAGSWALLYGLTFIYLFTTLGVGMFISTISGTQQQAMFFAWFFAIFAILTSGFFTPIANMPEIVQYSTYLNPLRYFMVVVRGIILKGASVDTLYPQIIAMLVFSALIFGFSWVRFSRRIS
jgi:ABC-2 type transport system permease protein